MMIDGLDSVKPYELQCVSQALDLFDVLSRTRGLLTLSHLSRCLGISKNKMFRLLTTLEQHGIVEKFGEGWYRFGGMAFALARRIIVSESIMDYARPIMAGLAERLNESIYLATNENGIALLRDMVDCRQAIKVSSFVGSGFSLQGNAVGGASAPELNPADYPGVTVDVGGLDMEITTVAAVFKDSRNPASGALVVLAPIYRMPLDRIRSEVAPALYSAAARLSGLLSAAPDENSKSGRPTLADHLKRSFDELGSVQPFNYQQSGLYYQRQM